MSILESLIGDTDEPCDHEWEVRRRPGDPVVHVHPPEDGQCIIETYRPAYEACSREGCSERRHSGHGAVTVAAHTIPAEPYFGPLPEMDNRCGDERE
jgi:hypothetical protein